MSATSQLATPGTNYKVKDFMEQRGKSCRVYDINTPQENGVGQICRGIENLGN